MLNEANQPEPSRQREFIEEIGRYFTRFGLSPTLGRVWGYLLLSPDPASLDGIAADLGISKSGASVATRQLEQFMMARRTGQPGSRRALYEANAISRRFFDQILGAYRVLIPILDSGVEASPDEAVRQRLQGAAGFFRSWVHEFEQLVSRLEEEARR
jgi:hypothetical protein